MNRVFRAFYEIVNVVFAENPFIVIATFTSAILVGVITPLSIWVNSQIFNLGLSVASGDFPFSKYIPYLILFIVFAILPVVIDMFNDIYIRLRCQVIIRTVYKGKMLQKLKLLQYKHLESASSMEIIEKTYNRAEGAAIAIFPSTVRQIISSSLSTVGILYLFGTVRWWLLPIILLPFALETWLAQRSNYSIADEMDSYWQKERSYTKLGSMLRSRDYIRENHLLGASYYLIDIYRKRLNARNRKYEDFFLKHLRRNFFKQNITKIVQLGCAIILLKLYIDREISIGMLVSLTMTIFTGLFNNMNAIVSILRTGGQHIKTFGFFDKYLELSEDEYGEDTIVPHDLTIEFDNVYFTYPDSDKPVLNGLSFKVSHGDKVSIVGANGEGKTTMIKLMLGLFQPDSGEIRIGGKPLVNYSQKVRTQLFGSVFQDFVKYSITLGENIGIGDVKNVKDSAAVVRAMNKARVDTFAEKLSNETNTLLGRDFEGGVDLSGGQWQRIAIARAFMGDKPILILDEPASQLDPIAESHIYSEFAEMSTGKTAIFITHRLGSTMITDRIYVIKGGRISQEGSHNELMKQGGLYADMFNAQKQWYIKSKEEVDFHA